MKGLNFVVLQEQLLQGQACNFTSAEEYGVQSSLFESGKGDLSLWHKTIQLPGVLIDHLKLKAPAPVLIKTAEHMPSTVNMSFTLQGESESLFESFDHQIQNVSKSHNLLYLANPAGQHVLKPFKQIENIYLAFQLDYFQHIACEDEPSFDKLRNNIACNKTTLLATQHGLIDLKIQQTLMDICNCVMKGSIKRLYLEAKVLELLALQIDSLIKPNPAAEDGANKDLFHQIKAYLAEHYLEELSLNSVCRHFGINEFKLKKGFQQYFQTSVIRFLTGLRMQQARQLLAHGESTILQVSELLNYSHPNHFSIAFKKYFGYAPSKVSRIRRVY